MFESRFFLGRDAQREASAGFVDGLAIGARGERDVLGVLVTAFDFQRGDADVHDLGNLFERVQVAGREQVTRIVERAHVAVDHQLVRQAAGLRALASVRAAASPGFGRKALAGVGHAQRAVDEDFESAVSLGADLADFGEREFSGEDYARDAEVARHADSFGAGDAHLRAAVDFEIRGDFTGQLHDSEILHDDSVSARFGDGRQALGGGGEFGIEDQRVVGDVAADAMAVGRCGAWLSWEALGEREADFRARGEVGQAEVDGVRARVHGGVELRPVADGAQDFGAVHIFIVSGVSLL